MKRDPDKTLEVLFEISSAVTQTRNLDELFAAIHRSLNLLLNVDNFYIAIYHPQKDSITFPYHVDEMDVDPEEIFHFSQVPSSTGQVIKQKKPLIFYEADIQRLARKLGKKALGATSKIWLGAPLKIRERVTGAIAIQSYRSASAYNHHDLELLNLISQHIALAIERKESEEKLSLNNKLLEKILESSPVGIAMLENHVFKWVNNEMVRLFGFPDKNSLEGQGEQVIFASSLDYGAVRKRVSTHLARSGKADFEMDLIRQDKRVFPAHVRISCADMTDPLSRVIAIYTDVSQRKTVEKEKYEKERLQGVLEMAGAVCHELNQPLQAILGYSELLMMKEEDHLPDDRRLHSIKYQAGRIENITRKLSGITQYKTKEYAGNTKIVDIWNADR
ncbi:MAG: GAF domain-containing protein [Desulfobacteraceae bacterium]|mgnify:CR=1 FL=1|nr:MAG: GAF domain-containing protein [Desulfobacteraceae bacterium]